MLGVAPFTGSVDWNSQSGSAFLLFQVAPFTGSVDWNRPIPPGNHNVLWSLPSRGAWIEIISIDDSISDNTSLPSRGAWIEMQYLLRTAVFYMVAPFTGSVDWNILFLPIIQPLDSSLPSRGAWIEIYWEKRKSQRMFVAPFTGSVDWNCNESHQRRGVRRRSLHGERGLKFAKRLIYRKLYICRSLHGERGLKFYPILHQIEPFASLPSRGAWIEIPLHN